MGAACSPNCNPTPKDEMQVFDGGADVLADSGKVLSTEDDGYTNDSKMITLEYEKDAAGERKYIQAHANSLRSHFDKEFDELVTTDAVDADIQEERPTYTFGTGARYDGQWKGRRRHGFGVQKWTDGSSYEGQWRGDQAYGHGRFVLGTGQVAYIGQWKHNMSQGAGIAYHEDHTYVGQWVNDLQAGYGVETWTSDGAKYEGDFKEGTKDGFGKYSWPNGHVQYGAWKNGMMDGRAEFRGNDGNKFQGTWADDRKTGIGKYMWANGEIYEGQYVQDQREGYGIFYFTDGKDQRGFWKAGQPVK
mmetsp:Transcript_84211/g.234902  ORF Transcript_84211/g.234902 Transcript_84211/m.234902 type:complete len:303 (-) Transcript_84211:174-1082(-)|eukprot:CAMPEP_0117527934 /NCGR_PEP_ID=MMETSP0784-20121206/37055_1 /TAXON_ID=39447 /ORGANISM="" /LENGTH=302 /DNA_ID=CAMNT_0005324205 /DNA_START=71 /DNA_END=979 /DNA_ORIENTATION=-